MAKISKRVISIQIMYYIISDNIYDNLQALIQHRRIEIIRNIISIIVSPEQKV